MRNTIPMAVIVTLMLAASPVCAASHYQAQFDPQAIAALEARASQAEPRDRCFLYAQLVHDLAELSLRQYAAGQVDAATGLLLKIQSVAQKIHLSLGTNNKRLKNAEILLSRASFRLGELLHSSEYSDRALVEKTIADVNHAQNEAMMQLFRR